MNESSEIYEIHFNCNLFEDLFAISIQMIYLKQ
jgi:hypothetical protein